MWKAIATSVNAVGQTERSVNDLRRKWDDIKSRTKKRANEIKKDGNKTGGGEMNARSLTELEELIISIIGDKLVYGIKGAIDTTAFEGGRDSPAPSTTSAAHSEITVSSEDDGDVNDGAKLRLKRENVEPDVRAEYRDEKIHVKSVERQIARKETLDYSKVLLDVETQRLEIERRRLQIEERRLEIEERRIIIEESRLQQQLPSGIDSSGYSLCDL